MKMKILLVTFLAFLALVATVAAIRLSVHWVTASHPTDHMEGMVGTLIATPLALALAFAAWKIARSPLRSQTPGEVKCPECNYNMRGLSEARCPECGAEFTLDQLK